MQIIKPAERPLKDNPHGVDVRGLFRGEHAQVSLISLQPGERLRLHRTPVDALFYLLEGRGIVTVGTEEAEVDAEALVDSPAGLPHTWRNTGDGVLRILVLKTPPQSEPTELLE